MASLKIDKIQIKRFKSGIKDTILAAGEFGYDVLAGKLYLGNGTSNTEIAVNADLLAHINDGDAHITADERTKLAGIATGAQVNVIEKIKLNGAEISVVDKTVDLGSIATSTALGEIGTRVTNLEQDITEKANTADLGDLAGKDKVAEANLETELAGKVGNGATAYSWGDHSQEGYLKAADISGKADVTALEAEAKRATDEEARIEGLVISEAAKAREEEGKLNNRLVEVETFFKTTEGETLDQALDTLVEIQKYITDEGAAADQMVLDIAANKKAIDDHVATNHDFAGADAALKTQLESEIDKKVDKVEGKSLISDAEIARLANVDNYDDTTVKADIAKKADAATMTTELGKKVDKVTGYSLVSDTEIARLAGVNNYDDAAVRGLISDNADAIAAINNVDTGILKQAKDYADDLADNYDAAGAASTAEANAKSYADGKVGEIQAQIGTVATGKTINGRLDAIESAHNANGAISNPASQPSVLNKLVVENGHVVSGEFATLESLLDQLTFTIDAGEVE